MAVKKKSIFDLMNEQLDYTGVTGAHEGGGRGFYPLDIRDMAPGEGRQGTFNCAIIKAEFDETGVTFKDGDEQKTDPSLVFHYQVLDGEHEGKEWKGERFWIPLNVPAPTTDGQAYVREKEKERLVGHYETITGKEEVPQVGQMIMEMMEIVNDEEHTIHVEVQCEAYCKEVKKSRVSASGEDEATTSSNRVYTSEYLKQLLDVQ